MEGWVLLISVLFMGAYLPRRAIGTSVAFGRDLFSLLENLWLTDMSRCFLLYTMVPVCMAWLFELKEA